MHVCMYGIYPFISLLTYLLVIYPLSISYVYIQGAVSTDSVYMYPYISTHLLSVLSITSIYIHTYNVYNLSLLCSYALF